MKLFIDTANLNHINELVTYNVISGDNGDAWVQAKEEKYSPSRALICLLGTFLGGLCGLLVVFAQSLYFVRDS